MQLADFSQPLKGHCPHYALLGLIQAPGFAGGYDYSEFFLVYSSSSSTVVKHSPVTVSAQP